MLAVLVVYLQFFFLMLFIDLPIAELRSITKSNIETLELWLRRVVDESLSKSYGAEYWNFKYESGDCSLNKGIRDKINSFFIGDNSKRYTRWIDASFTEHLSEIIRNAMLYQKHFRYYFESYVPDNFSLDSSRQYLKYIFEQCIDVRNRVSHSNPISVRQAEKIACCPNDVIDSIKKYYLKNNL